MGVNIDRLHQKWSSDPEYRNAYDELAPEFEIARAVILARKGAGLMRFAQATGTRLKISFEAMGDTV